MIERFGTRERTALYEDVPPRKQKHGDGFVGPDLRFPLRDLILILVELFLG